MLAHNEAPSVCLMIMLACYIITRKKCLCLPIIEYWLYCTGHDCSNNDCVTAALTSSCCCCSCCCDLCKNHQAASLSKRLFKLSAYLPTGLDELAEGQSVVAARVEGASQEPTPDLLLTDHPIATAALAPEPAGARSDHTIPPPTPPPHPHLDPFPQFPTSVGQS